MSFSRRPSWGASTVMKSAFTPRSLAWEMIFLVRDRSELTYLPISDRFSEMMMHLQLKELDLTGNGGVHHLVKRAGSQCWKLLISTAQI
jgi:hypothetical protein